jgi:NYN domain
MAGDEGGQAPVRAALFVDFDNIYLGLRKLDEKAASAFATEPSTWLTWLESGRDAEAVGRRRFLVRNVYLNPAEFGTYRAIYTRAGFRTVDCPPLTGQGKNSADIYMVLDIIDALQGSFVYEEFVIASADADFTPILYRLRAQDRRVTLLTAGLSAAAYRAVCDSFVPPEVLADAALGEDTALAEADDEVPTQLVVAPSPSARGAAAARTPGGTAEQIGVVADAIRAAVRASDRPIVSAAAAQAALAVDPYLKESEWLGAGAFRAFLALYAEDLVYEGSPSPGYVYDPNRHTSADIPRREPLPELAPLLQQICAVTGAPALTSDRYAALFIALAEELRASPFSRNETPKRVRDRTDLLDAPVSRNAISFVTNGLIYSGVPLMAGVSARELGDGWVTNLKTLCANARLVLSPEDEREVEEWIVGGIAPTQ